MTAFSDHFSGHASDYRKYRPRYPRELADFLAECVPRRSRAWDVATGNGQAATLLAPHFEKVIATDASAEQISQAEQRDTVEYRVAPAEASGLEDRSIDLITVAQALHWFDQDAFHAEADRVLAEGGVIAVWCYAHFAISPEVDAVVRHFYQDVVGPFWPPERVHIENAYHDLPWPYDPHARQPDAQGFSMELEWTMNDVVGYLATWSATKRYEKEHGRNPLQSILERLQTAWGEPELARLVRWPLAVKLGLRGT